MQNPKNLDKVPIEFFERTEELFQKKDDGIITESEIEELNARNKFIEEFSEVYFDVLKTPIPPILEKYLVPYLFPESEK